MLTGHQSHRHSQLSVWIHASAIVSHKATDHLEVERAENAGDDAPVSFDSGLVVRREKHNLAEALDKNEHGGDHYALIRIDANQCAVVVEVDSVELPVSQKAIRDVVAIPRQITKEVQHFVRQCGLEQSIDYAFDMHSEQHTAIIEDVFRQIWLREEIKTILLNVSHWVVQFFRIRFTYTGDDRLCYILRQAGEPVEDCALVDLDRADFFLLDFATPLLTLENDELVQLNEENNGACHSPEIIFGSFPDDCRVLINAKFEI